MTELELIADVARNAGKPRKHVKAVLRASAAAILNSLAHGERVLFFGAGVFTVFESTTTPRYSGLTGERYTSKVKRRVKFKPSPELKRAINE